jgi:DNA-binding transcriptional regulator YdaS (Cro superfamily)
MMRPMDKLARVIDAAGGVSALAALLGVKPPTVSQWKAGDRPVPPRFALAIARKWPGLASVYDLRRDVFGPPPGEADEGEAA